MSNKPYLVTGANDFRETHPRLEIRHLVNNPEQFSLFIQAWINIRDPSYSPLAAQHVQIGGIHGLPYTVWPGDSQGGPGVDAAWQGYCNHSSVLFPTWHRPYIMLLEQSICHEVQTVLSGLTLDPSNEAVWKKAAREVRFPFWDWTLPVTGTEGLPQIFMDKNLSLLMPDGTTKIVDNILAFYDFGSQSQLPTGFKTVEESNPLSGETRYTSYFGDWTRTYRWPNSIKSDVIENYAELNSTLTNPDSHTRGSYSEIVSKVAQLFSYPCMDKRLHMIWDQFSNTRGQSKATFNFNLASIEQPHNTVHLVVGGSGGDMMDNDYAAFDPIFFLHHCNVDRILALWEHVYPLYWIGTKGYETPSGSLVPFTQQDGTFSEKDDATVNELSSLTPYRNENGTYWTSNNARSVLKGGLPKYYTYLPVVGISLDKSPTLEECAKHLRALQDYFGHTPTLKRDRQVIIKQGLYKRDSEDVLPLRREPVANFRQFVINVEVVEHAFEGSYYLEILYTANDGKIYGVGATAVLGRQSGTQCGACAGRRQGGSKVFDSLHIPHHIMVKIIEDKDLNHDHVGDVEFSDAIRKCFHAQIVTPGGLPHAQARRNVSGQPLDRAIAPKLQLVSANVCALKGIDSTDASNPWEFYDWQEHGSFLGNEWVVHN